MERFTKLFLLKNHKVKVFPTQQVTISQFQMEPTQIMLGKVKQLRDRGIRVEDERKRENAIQDLRASQTRNPLSIDCW